MKQMWPLVFALLVACGGDDKPALINQPIDSDGDGLEDSIDPTPNGSDANVLTGVLSGGAARVVTIWSIDGEGLQAPGEDVYDDNLDAPCDDSWTPQQTLCEAGSEHSRTLSTKVIGDSGATWSCDIGDITGILVVDACFDESCTVVDFNEARVFQMFSDGKITHLRLSVHPATTATPPAFDDAGWTAVTGFEAIGAGASDDVDALVVSAPTSIAISPAQVTRYVKIEAKNDGTLGDSDYIELRGVKLFGAPAL